MKPLWYITSTFYFKNYNLKVVKMGIPSGAVILVWLLQHAPRSCKQK